MGLFNKVFRGMGFKENEKPVSSPNATADKYANFENGLASTFNTSEFKNPDDVIASIPGLAGGLGGKNMLIYSPKDNKDIKVIVECLRRREAVIVNLAQIKAVDADRILQFLSGAVYALKGSIKRLQGDLFLITPEGVNIMTQK